MINDTAVSFDEASVVENSAIEQELLSTPITPDILKCLLDKLDVALPKGKIVQACQFAQQHLSDEIPVKRINLILQQLPLQGRSVQAAQLHWGRFDQRRLPALVFHQSSWHCAERATEGQISLTNAAGETFFVDEIRLSDCLVLWLKVLSKRQHDSAFSLRKNLAARLVLREMFRSKRWLMDVLIATVVINAIAIATSLFAMQVYDRVVPTLAYATLTTLVVIMVLVVVLDALLKTVRARILDSVSSAVDKAVSQEVFNHVMGLQLDTRPRSLGTLAAQVSGLDSVRQFFSSTVVFALVDLPFTLFFIAMIAVIGGSVSWVYIALLPLAVSLGWLTQLRLRRLLKQQLIRSNERQGLLVDVIQGAESIRANNASWRFAEQWHEITQSISRYGLHQKAISNFAVVMTGSLSKTAYVAALVVGVGQIEAGYLTMGGLIACSILGGRVIAPVSQSVQYLTQWQSVLQSLDMVSQVLSLNTERRTDQTLLLPDELAPVVRVEKLSFSYPESPVKQLAIDTLTIKGGERLVVLGAVGSGKSTLLKVLAGLYKPAEGRIRIGNADLWEIDPQLVAEKIGYLPQSVHLFKGTLRSNLALSGAVSDSHLLQICEEIGIDNIAADNPLGMDLPISEGGEGLSGGQRQLVGIGRVLLAQPSVWILDEPTATLDRETEKQVLDTINKYVKADDILVISTHKPAIAAQLATRVLVMQRGQIVADAKPEEVLPKLMNMNPSAKKTQGSMNAPLPKGYREMGKEGNHVI